MATKKSRKKKAKKQEVQVPFPVLLSYVLVAVTVLGLSYMWLNTQCDALGRQIKSKESELKIAQKRRDAVRGVWSQKTSPNNLHSMMKRHGLNMTFRPESDNLNVVYDRGASGGSYALIK